MLSRFRGPDPIMQVLFQLITHIVTIAGTAGGRSVLLVLAITIHNVREGFAVGVACGATAAGLPGATRGVAMARARGIGIQHVPEGAEASWPVIRVRLSRAQLLVKSVLRRGGAAGRRTSESDARLAVMMLREVAIG